jgi:fluoride exporter
VPDESLPIDPDVVPSERLLAEVRGRGGSALLRDRWDVLLVIAVGGALGSVTRWGIGRLLPWSVDRFPWATLLENVSGALLLGILMVLVVEVWPASRYLRPFLGVGVLGGYTTFSTYTLEIRDLLATGRVATAMAYLFISVVAGLLAVWLGLITARGGVRARGRGDAVGAG